jgi:Cu2+-exporting ATPase
VASAIVNAGCEDFYIKRDGSSVTGEELVPEFLREAKLYDRDDVQASFVIKEDASIRHTSLILEGITCAACIWLNEMQVGKIPGVESFQANYATHRAHLRWDSDQVALSDVLAAIRAIGYAAHPYDPQRQQAQFERERKVHLRRLGLAGVMGAQVMMLSVALYMGDWTGMDRRYAALMHWASLLLTLPVVLFSARTFFESAWRDLANHRVGMDVPVSLGIVVAAGASLWAMLTQVGYVYFDSITMFVFFLLASRYFELTARKKSAEQAERLGCALPVVASLLLDNGEYEQVAVGDLQPDDRVLVRPGQAIPIDGVVVDGRSGVDESLLTGESQPLIKSLNDRVVGGSTNIDSPLQIRVTQSAGLGVMSEIMRLLEQAQMEKRFITRLADRVAKWFVVVLLVIAAGVSVYWWYMDPDRMLPIVISMLVVTCPCALSLATPTAIAAASGALLERGVLIAGGGVLETLARANHFVFDKTGTLTEGRLDVVECQISGSLSRADCLQRVAALEAQSEHPVAKALTDYIGKVTALSVSDTHNYPGSGLVGSVEGQRLFLGTPDYVQNQCALDFDDLSQNQTHHAEMTEVVLADESEVLCRFFLHDHPRKDAQDLIAALISQAKVSLLSGDKSGVVNRVALDLGITAAEGRLSPDDKLARVKAMQARGDVVVMVGDGVNDAPVLGVADVSVAMGTAASLTQVRADLILMSDQLQSLGFAISIARRTRSVIGQNLLWALVYNLCAVPAAAMGYVSPWMAAVGMSASSLLVVANALRLKR